MADNTTLQSSTLATPPAGLVVATDQIGGIDYQRVKVTWGVDGTATDASATNPLPVTLANTGANSTALKVDGSAVTQPISGTVTGSNFPATVDTNSGVKSASTLRVVLATDQPALTNKLLVTPDSVALPANQSVNVNQIAGTATDTNSGNKSAGTMRVVLATDQPALTNKILVTPDSVALPANQSVNVSQINGVTTTMGNGVSGTGVQRVTIASDSTGQINTVAHDLLYDTGTNGYIASLTLTAGTDLASLASGGAVTLTGGGSSGVSSQSNTGSGLLAEVVFKTVTAGFTPTAGGCISGWWLKSDDGGSNYETTPATASTTVPALARPPDFLIPLDAAALGTTAIKFSTYCQPPPGTFKVLVQNNSGAAFGAGNYTLTLRAIAKKN